MDFIMNNIKNGIPEFSSTILTENDLQIPCKTILSMSFTFYTLLRISGIVMFLFINGIATS